MERVSSRTLNQICNRLPVEKVVRLTVVLEEGGPRGLEGTCPFCREDHLAVDARRGLWYCYKCRDGGTIFNWVMKMDCCSFLRAAAHLAQVAGVELVLEKVPSPNGDILKDLRDFVLPLLEIGPESHIYQKYIQLRKKYEYWAPSTSWPKEQAQAGTAPSPLNTPQVSSPRPERPTAPEP